MDGNQDGERSAGRGQERRAYPRYSLDEECLLLLVNHGMPVKGRVVDLSMDGCRVRASEPFAAKAGRTVEISFKVKGFAFRFCGVVRWSDGHQIAGIHFENMIPRRKVDLVEVIDEMAETAARARPAGESATEHHIPPPVLPEPKSTEARPARSEAPKPPEPPVVVKATEPLAQIPSAESETPAKPDPSAPRPNKGSDRRGQARHGVDTTAIIFLVKVASALRGRIVDLSVGGCRIRTDDKFPVGIYTRVEVEFYLQGLPFRLGGVIQAIHNRFMVGIRFLDLGERKRQQVLDLIEEIEEMRSAMPHEEGPSPQLQDPTANH